MMYTGSVGNYILTSPDTIEYNVYGNSGFNASPTAKEILIPAVVNDSGALVFSDQDLLTPLSYQPDSMIPNLSYVKTEYGTMIAIHRPLDPRNDGQHFSFVLKKENIIGKKISISPQIATGFFPPTVTTLVYNPVPEEIGQQGIYLWITDYKRGENVTHVYITDSSAGPLKNYGFINVDLFEFGRYSDWAGLFPRFY